MSDSLAVLSARLRAFAEDRDWERDHTPRNLAVSIAIEVGELLEHYQWVVDDGEWEVAIDKVTDEIADVGIYLIRLADVHGIELGAAIDAKITRNGERFPAIRA